MRRYWFSRPSIAVLKLLIVLFALGALVWYAHMVIATIWSKQFAFDSSGWCEENERECNASLSLLTSLLTLGLATASFIVWRLWSAKRHIRRKARARAQDFVPTARNSIIERVVGRDELCEVIALELKDRDSRRPHLLIGGVGAGKTAVIVHLTEMLAQRGVIPVPVRLRDVSGDELDFSDLARDCYRKETDEAMLTKGLSIRATGDQAWRWLRKEDRVVVLADGLEEVFADGDKARDRDNKIRNAIHKADEQKLPLVMASRPHAPLRDVEAAVTELEPLSEEAAILYVESAGPSEDEHRLDWLIEGGGVSEAPLYLQVAKQLYESGRLEHPVGGDESHRLDTRNQDRAGLRQHLLKTWVDALIEGDLLPALALTRGDRVAAVAQVSALACIGLQQDTLEVRFADLQPPDDSAGPPKHPQVLKQLQDELNTLGSAGEGTSGLAIIDLPLAATWAEQMRLVEAHGEYARFQHSIMQAYLGSRFMDAALGKTSRRGRRGQAHDFFDEAVHPSSGRGPSREFLLSLVFLSRDSSDGGTSRWTGRMVDDCVERLVEAAERRQEKDLRPDEKALDLYAAALEIDCGHTGERLRGIAASAGAHWQALKSRDEQGLEAAKLTFVHRLGAALRDLEKRRRGRGRTRLGADIEADIAAAYGHLFDIGGHEPLYAVRLAIAEEIGCGGDLAFDALSDHLHHAWESVEAPPHPSPVATRRAGRGDEEEAHRRRTMCAWLTPMLVASVKDDERRDHAKSHLAECLRPIREQAAGRTMAPMPLSREIALSQGFKAAANRRKRHFATSRAGEAILVDAAGEMLRSARFWYSQVTLLQALTLWALPDTPEPTVSDTNAAPSPERWQHQSPRDQVHRWLSDARVATSAAHERLQGRKALRRWRYTFPLVRWRTQEIRRQVHPFVCEAGELAVKALRSRHPERYLWIDESGVANKVGSRPVDPGERRIHQLWIPPSTGWTALDRHAQQLVADVLLLLNLAERGDPDDHERYLDRANKPDLPPCLIGDRAPMRPRLSVARAGDRDPGFSCVDGCSFKLCPYPPRGTPERQELGEAFARGQQALLTTRRRNWLGVGPAPWQRAGLSVVRRNKVRDLRAFWRAMADRRRVPPADGLTRPDGTVPGERSLQRRGT